MALKKKPPLPLPRDVPDHDHLRPPRVPARPRPQPQPEQPERPRGGGETVYKTAVFLGSTIVVAVLLLVLICMARWESIVRLFPAVSSWDLRRWMRRRRRSRAGRRSRDDSARRSRDLDLEASPEDFSMSNGLSKKNRSNNRRALEALGVVNYSAANPDDNLALGCLVGTECTICLSEFADGDRIRILPDCYHGFHVECVDVWLIAHASCPSCRKNLHAPSFVSKLEDQQQDPQQQDPPQPQQEQQHQQQQPITSSSSSSSSSQTTFI